MHHTFVVYVENKPGVLSRVVSLFRRRVFNIDSLTVGRTEKPDVSRMTIVVDSDEDQARRIVANVYKLVNVLLVDALRTGRIARDLCLIKISAPQEIRSQVLELAPCFERASLTSRPIRSPWRLRDSRKKSDRLLEMLRPFGLLEVVRTGLVAMRRGMQITKSAAKSSGVTQVADDGTVSYSV